METSSSLPPHPVLVFHLLATIQDRTPTKLLLRTVHPYPLLCRLQVTDSNF